MRDKVKPREQIAGMLFALPFIVGFLLFLAYPLCKAVYFSFTDYPFLNEPVFVGGRKYARMLGDPLFWKSLRNTLAFALMSVPFSLGISVTLALLLNQKVRSPGVWRTIIFLPSLVPSVASAMLWLWLLNGKDGLINHLLEPVRGGLLSFSDYVASGPWGISHAGSALQWLMGYWPATVPWLTSESLVLPTLALIGFWGVGQTVVIFLAGLQDIPSEMYEAAEIDGASAFQRLRHVTLPMLSPVIFFNLVMGIIGAWSVFDGPYILTGGGGTNRSAYFYAMYIRDAAFLQTDVGYASALACVQFLIVMTLTGLVIWSSKRWVHYR